MRILVLNHNITERGTYCRAFPFARHLAARGHEVVFCCVHPVRMYRPTVTRIDVGEGRSLLRYEMPNWSGKQERQEGRGPIDIVRRSWLALTRRFDVAWAFSHKFNAVIPARIAQKLHGATFISDWCDRWGGEEGLFEFAVLNSESFKQLPPDVQKTRRRAFAQEAVWEEKVRRVWADGVTVISRALYERTLGLGVPPSQVLRIHSGANLEEIKPLDKTACRRELGLSLPPDASVLGYVANFHADEALFLDALERIVARDPAVRFVHCGAPFSTGAPDLKRRGVFDRFHYLGWVPIDTLPKVLGASDILMLPLSSRRLNVERWPHKITDYLAAGRPVAACDVGDVADLVRAGDSGRLGEPTAEGLAEATLYLLNRRDVWDAMGRRARQTAESRLDWRRLGDAAMDFIIRVRETPRAAPRRERGFR